jgi:hypothetical protein
MRRTRMSSSSIVLMAEEEFEFCRNNPAYFIRNYLNIEDKDADGLMIPFDLWPAQEFSLYSIIDHKYNIILKARQIGFTWLVLGYIMHDLIFNIGHSAMAISKTEDDGFELVRRFSVIATKACHAMLNRLDIKIVHVNKSEVQIIKGEIASRFICFPTSSDAARSFTGNILFFDEFAFAKNAAALWTGAQATVNRPGGGKVIILSTMLRGTKYEEIWCDESNGFNRIFLGCFADPRRTLKWYKETERVQGKKILQEYPRTAAEALANLEGIFFEEFDPAVHVCRPFDIPTHWRIYSSLDFGLDMLAHYKYAIDEEGVVYVFHEIHKSNLIVHEASRLILEADRREGYSWLVPEERLAPPDLYRVTPESGRSQAQVFYEDGVTLIKVSNDREAGWLAVKSLMREGRLKIFSTCSNLIRCLSQICIDEKRAGDCKKEPHDLTHAPDALRYFAIWYQKPAESADKSQERRREWTSDIYEDYISGSKEVKAIILRKYGKPSNYSI